MTNRKITGVVVEVRSRQEGITRIFDICQKGDIQAGRPVYMCVCVYIHIYIYIYIYIYIFREREREREREKQG